MAEEYITPGYIDPGYYESQAAPPPPPEGEFDLDIGEPGAPRHRTAFGSEAALQMAYWQPGSPWAPYDLQPIFVYKDHFGFYAFSTRGVPESIVASVYSFETTLVDPEPTAFRSSPIHDNIVGSIGAIERPHGRVTIRDPEAVWLKRLSRQATVTMPGGLFLIVKRLRAEPVLTGSIGRATWEDYQTVIEFGDFRRRTPIRPVVLSF